MGSVMGRMRSVMLIGTGFLLCSLGYTGLVFKLSFLGYLACAAAVGTGSALYDPTLRSIMAQLSKESKNKAFTYFNQSLNGGAILGALFGAILITFSGSNAPLLFGGAIYFILFVLTFKFPSHFPNRDQETVSDSSVSVWNHLPFIRFTLILSLFWMMYVQLTAALPLQLFHLTGRSDWSSLIVITNGALAFLFMFFMRYRFDTDHCIQLIRTGLLIMGLGLALTPWISSSIWVLFCVLLFTLGETLALPGMDIAVAEYSGLRNTGAFYSIFSLSYALGGSIGNYTGTWLLQQFPGSLWPWCCFVVMGVLDG